jgi:hypothetical protein
MLKPFKSYNTCPEMFSVHAGTIIREQSCAWLKIQIRLFSVLVDIDSVKCYGGISACCEGVRLRWRNAIALTEPISKRTEKTIYVVLAKQRTAP